MILDSSHIFADDIITVVTDASLLTIDEHNPRARHRLVNEPGALVLTSSGIKVMRGDRTLLNTVIKLKNSTNNIGELLAVFQGVIMGTRAAQENGLKKVVLYSDSQLCINGLTDWLHGWIKNSRGGIMYNSSGEEVKNQWLYRLIIQFILCHPEIKYRFVKVRGHIDPNNDRDLDKAFNYINRNNSMFKYDTIGKHAVAILSRLNDDVDNFSRNALEQDARINGGYCFYEYTDAADLERSVPFLKVLTLDDYRTYAKIVDIR